MDEVYPGTDGSKTTPHVATWLQRSSGAGQTLRGGLLIASRTGDGGAVRSVTTAPAAGERAL